MIPDTGYLLLTSYDIEVDFHKYICYMYLSMFVYYVFPKANITEFTECFKAEEISDYSGALKKPKLEKLRDQAYYYIFMIVYTMSAKMREITSK